MRKNKTSNQFKILLLIVIYSILAPNNDSFLLSQSSSTKNIEESLSISSEQPGLLLLDPEINGYTVKQNGVVTGAVKPLRFDWGDHEVTEDWFPGIHQYNKTGTYTITVTAYGKGGTENNATKTVSILRPDRGTVDGYVIDAFLRTGIEGVEVHGASHTTYTDSSGYYKLENLTAGEHRFHFNKHEYDIKRPGITVISGKSISYSTALKPKNYGHLRGRVITPTGEGAAGAAVTWPGRYGYDKISTTTDIGGNYLLRLIPEGTRTFTFYLEGCEMQTHEKTIAEDMVNVLDVTIDAAIAQIFFDFKKQLFDKFSTLSVWVEKINRNTGEVTINGVDTQQPQTPFTWDWKDKLKPIYDGAFPQNHIYSDITQNYTVRVSAHYPDGTTDSAEISVRFVPPLINKIELPPEILVEIPNYEEYSEIEPGMPKNKKITYFDETYFEIVPRPTIEYVLSVAASIQRDFVNDNVFQLQVNGSFNQVLLKDDNPLEDEEMYSLWYTDPVGFVSEDKALQETIHWSSFFHELGHNFTLNSPSGYQYGGKIDGCANAIFSESIAQIFQHAAAYEMINEFYRDNKYGLTENIVDEIKQSAVISMKNVRKHYEKYIDEGKNFCSWNIDCDQPKNTDETFETFMTIAFKFFEHAEERGEGYKIPLKRMMEFLQLFNESIKDDYAPGSNSPEADEFRATFMVTALSYAFLSDLRTEFRELNFPINDEIYDNLRSLAEK